MEYKACILNEWRMCAYADSFCPTVFSSETTSVCIDMIRLNDFSAGWTVLVCPYRFFVHGLSHVNSRA